MPGKSVGVNTLVVSILYKAKPDEVKFIMVDPKRLELGRLRRHSASRDADHHRSETSCDLAQMGGFGEMERRYKHLAGWGVRNIDGFNSEVKRRNKAKKFDEDGESS